jgi:hypothetical protein
MRLFLQEGCVRYVNALFQEGINQLSQDKALVMVLAPVALTKMNCVE